MYIYKKGAIQGFTLAEVLITLGIIGVVAALTMPSLIAKYKERETIVKVKKMYSLMSQAYLFVLQEQDSPDNWGYTAGGNVNNGAIFAGYIKPYLVVSKDCAYDAGCFPNLAYKQFGGTTSLNFLSSPVRYMMRLNDGSAIALYAYPENVDGYYGVIYYDTNGDKPPNQFGEDLFQFMVMKDRLMAGAQVDKDNNIYTDCITTGFSCAAWVIVNDNMDYAHCPDELSWNGKTKCD